MTLCSKCNTYPMEFNVPEALCHPCWMKWLLRTELPPKPEKSYFKNLIKKKKVKKKAVSPMKEQIAISDLYVESAIYDLGKDASKEEILDHILKLSHNQLPLQQVKLTILRRLGIKDEPIEETISS